MGIKGVFLDLRNNSHVILVKSVDLTHKLFFVSNDCKLFLKRVKTQQ